MSSIEISTDADGVDNTYSVTLWGKVVLKSYN